MNQWLDYVTTIVCKPSTNMSDHTISAFTKGIHNLLNPELIPMDAAQDSKGWFTKDGKIVLSYGRKVTGNDTSTSGRINGLFFGYKTDGSKVMYRKTSTKIQYLKVNTWTDIITGLTAGSDYSFTNYSSLAGAFTFVVGIDGIWKIVNAFPENPINLTNSVQNFKGKGLIDRGRMLLWDRPEDKTGLYGSYIDNQSSSYTTVTNETLDTSGSTNYTGNLAEASGTRNVFGLTITGTIAAGVETFTDNYDGSLTGSRGGTGTINYVTGAYDITFHTAVVSGDVIATSYQWEDSNVHSVTDFTHTASRLAGEGFQFPQDIGGDAILNVLLGQDGSYYSMKSQSAYILTLDDTDLAATNVVYRTDIGIPSYRAAVSTNKGIVFINTANPAKPEMTVLQRSIVGNTVEPVALFPHFKFANYDYSDCALDTWERYVVVFCKEIGSLSNDTVLLCDTATGTVDSIPYAGRCSAKDSGNLYLGSPLTENVYQIFNGFDDLGISITNYWIGKNDQYQLASGFSRSLRYQIGERLKRYRRQKIKGIIDPAQKIQIYVDCDESGPQLVGTILGTGDYVDYSSPQSIGKIIGGSQIGGDDTTTVAYPFFTEIKVKLPKFRTRTITLIATGIGYAEVQFLSDWDILVFEQRLPTRFRQKQNVSLDGTESDLPQT